MPSLRDISRKFTGRYCMYRYGPTSAPELDPPSIGGMAWQLLDEGAVNKLFAGDGSRQRIFLQFLKQGHLGAVVTINGVWAAHVWTATPDHARPPQIPDSMEPQTYWLFFSSTQPEWGGKGIYKFVMRYLLAEIFRRTPVPEILADVEPENVPPRRGTVSIGFVPEGMLDCKYAWLPGMQRIPLTWHWDKAAPHPPMPG